MATVNLFENMNDDFKVLLCAPECGRRSWMFETDTKTLPSYQFGTMNSDANSSGALQIVAYVPRISRNE